MSSKARLNIFAFITVALWAAAFPATKIAGESFSPYCLGLIRCIVASIALLVAGRFLKIRKPFCIRDLLLMSAAGVCGFALYLIFFNTGILTITSATSSVIIASTPIMTAIVCSRLYNEKIRPLGWLAICIAFIGVCILLFWKGALSINAGILWTLGAAIVFCIYNILNRKLTSIGYTSVEIVTYAMISASVLMIFFLPETINEVSHANSFNILLAIALGLLPSATSYVLWAKAMELAEKTNEVTNYMFITPLLSAIMGFAMLGEIPDMGTLIGGLIIIISVILFGTKGK